jgi:ATP-dependent RNA helicase HelY
MRLERETEAIRRRDGERSNSIARAFDRICGVLEALGYLGGERGDELTPQGRTLTRIYGELDLVTAECVRGGVFDDLTVPQLAAVLSTLVFESRAADGRRLSRMPDRPSEAAQSRLRQVWREVGLVERDHRVERGPEPDIGFAEAAYAWASGESLGEVVENHHLTAGDFVRWVRQVIDAAAQLTDAVGSGPPARHLPRGGVGDAPRVIAVEATDVSTARAGGRPKSVGLRDRRHVEVGDPEAGVTV